MADEAAKRLLADAFDCGGWTTLTVASESLATMLPELDPAMEADFRRLGVWLEKLVGDQHLFNSVLRGASETEADYSDGGFPRIDLIPLRRVLPSSRLSFDA